MGGYCDTIKTSEDYSEIMGKADEVNSELLKGLTEEQKELLEELSNLEMDAEAEACTTHFVEGVKFGMRFGVEGME